MVRMMSSTTDTHPNGDSGPGNGTETPLRPVCPYCGGTTITGNQCTSCGGHQDPLSRQATQNAMGPWFVRDQGQPFRPGCSFDTIARMVRSGKITTETIVRGPSTHQFWVPASKAAGLAKLLGVCHACGNEVGTDEFVCRGCGAALDAERDRQHLGLGATRAVPGRTPLTEIAAAPHTGPAGGDGIGAEIRADADARSGGHEQAGPFSQATPQQTSHGLDAMTSRVSRLERTIRRERRLRALMLSFCVVLIGALVVTVALKSSIKADPVGPPAGGAEIGMGEGDGSSGEGIVPVEAVPEDPDALPDLLPEPSAETMGLDTSEADLDAWVEIEREILDPETVHDEAWLRSQIERLEAMRDGGTLPASGERLLEALRAELDQLRLRVLP